MLPQRLAEYEDVGKGFPTYGKLSMRPGQANGAAKAAPFAWVCGGQCALMRLRPACLAV